MDRYKKIIKSKKLRFRIIKLFSHIPDKTMLKVQYRIKLKRHLNLDNPQRFTEKIQWYKLHYKDPLMAKCADKYLVREYVESKGLGSMLNELYAVFDSPDKIDISALPDEFVLKLSNGSGTNLICRDKSALDNESVRKKFKDFVEQSATLAGREWVYGKYPPVIIAEKLLKDPLYKDGVPTDYKIFCFNGKPEYISCVLGRYTGRSNHLYYNTKWEKINVVTEDGDIEKDAPKPENLDKMLTVAACLSADFPFARIDLYSLEGKIYFGEITFYPWSGYMVCNPDSFDFELGKHFELPEKKED